MKKLFIIRGTGFTIDGTVVSIEEEQSSGYCVVLPLSTAAKNSILVHRKYLEELSNIDSQKLFKYQIAISKFDHTGLYLEESTEIIENCLRDVDTHVLVSNYCDYITPVLQLK